METYIRTVKYSDVVNLLEDESDTRIINLNEDKEPSFLIQVFLTQNIEDIGIYDDLVGNKRIDVDISDQIIDR